MIFLSIEIFSRREIRRKDDTLMRVRKLDSNCLPFDLGFSWLISACEVVLPAVIGWFTLKNLSTVVDDEYGG